MSEEELANRFRYHPPDQDKVQVHEHIRERVWELATYINLRVPDGREKDLSLSKLEDAMFWANAGVARMTPEGDRL